MNQPLRLDPFRRFADPPRVTLQLGKGLREPVIEEGRDLYFECVVRANPAASLVQWFHNGASLEPTANATSGLLSTGRYLVVRHVRATQAGTYSCSAHNALATTESNSVLLTVQCAKLTCSLLCMEKN